MFVIQAIERKTSVPGNSVEHFHFPIANSDSDIP